MALLYIANDGSKFRDFSQSDAKKDYGVKTMMMISVSNQARLLLGLYKLTAASTSLYPVVTVSIYGKRSRISGRWGVCPFLRVFFDQQTMSILLVNLAVGASWALLTGHKYLPVILN